MSLKIGPVIITSKVYQVKVLHASVRRSIEITNNTTFMHRFNSMLLDSVNRRALGASTSVLPKLLLMSITRFSRRMWHASLSAIMWF